MIYTDGTTWKIETLNHSVDKELEALPEDMQARFFWIGELIRSRGLEKVGEPYVKHLQGGLWEMRRRAKTEYHGRFMWLLNRKELLWYEFLSRKHRKHRKKN